MKKGKRLGISRKVIIAIVVFTLLLNALMCAGGAVLFNRAIQKLYNERGYTVGRIILDAIDHDKIAEYARTWEEDEYYREMSAYLEQVLKNTGAAYIYIGVPYEDKTMRYVYDSGSEIGFVDPIAAPFDEVWRAYTEGVRPESYFVRKSQYGFLTSSCLPVRDSSGNVVALLFVDTNMEEILSILHGFILNMVLIGLILLGIYCIVTWFYVHRRLLWPIMAIRDSVRSFASNSGQADESLMKIRTNDEIEDLAVSVSSMEKEIVDNIENIRSITAEKERIGAELNIAAKIQADMLPRKFPPFPERKEFDIFASMTPAKEVGGDFYDFFLIDDDHLALVMADVSGKGIPAALFMTVVKTLIKNRTLTGGDLSPAAILADVNAQLCEGNDVDMFVTVWLGILQISTGKGIAANAGHEHPAIRRAGGRFGLSVYKHSLAVAAMQDTGFLEHPFEMHPGDVLFVYTDGVPEAINSREEMFGVERMLRALNTDPDADLETLLGNVREAMGRFVGEAPQFDDVTMMGFVYKG